MLEFLVLLIVVVGIALVLDWVVGKLLSDLAYPARIIIGIVAVIVILTRGWPLLKSYL